MHFINNLLMQHVKYIGQNYDTTTASSHWSRLTVFTITRSNDWVQL